MTVHQAVKELRNSFRESQQVFATRLGLSIRAIANYEKNRTPNEQIMGILLHEANKAGRQDLAEAFMGDWLIE